MAGAHLVSWNYATAATDDAVGCVPPGSDRADMELNPEHENFSLYFNLGRSWQNPRGLSPA